MLIHGDCLAALNDLPSESVDCILTDAPYGMSYQSSHRAKRFERIDGDDNTEVFERALPLMGRVLRPNRHAYFFCSWHKVDRFKQAIELNGFQIKNIIVWVKNNHGAGDLKGSYSPKHEFVIFAHKGRRAIRGKRHPDVIECPRVAGNAMVHPTEKPVALMERMILTSTDASEVVLDPFMGSGSTGVAAVAAGRSFTGIERDAAYFDIARNRIDAARASNPPPHG